MTPKGKEAQRETLSAEELAKQKGEALPDREVMSIVSTDPSAEALLVLDDIEQVQGVPAADEAPVGDERVTIQPVKEER